MLFVVGMILFWLILIISIAIIPFGIPGTFLIVADTFVYALITHFEKISPVFIGVLLAVSIIVELVEFGMSAWAAKKYGSSSWGMWGAIIGGFFGAVVLTTFLPPFGTIFGAFIGAFAGAFLIEFLHNQEFQKALRIGWGAFLGAVSGKLLKIVAAIAMVVAVGVKIF